VSRKFRRSRRCQGLSAVLALAYRRRLNSAGEALLFPFLLKLSPSPTSFLPFNYSSPLPKWPPLLAPSAPLPPRPSPKSLWPLPAALRLLSASRGEPGASPRARWVSYSVPRVGKMSRRSLCEGELVVERCSTCLVELYAVTDC
jgi:hypothetical protein